MFLSFLYPSDTLRAEFFLGYMMNTRQYGVIGIIVFAILFAVFSYYYRSQKVLLSGKEKKIAILKTASHPALDQAERGFLDVIEKQFGTSVICDVKNADGSIVAMNTIADAFVHDESVALFYSIATPALQALAQKERIRPIIFAAVTDPRILAIDSDRNVCGVTDAIDVKRQMMSIAQFVKDIKSIAVLYNTAELNSIHVVRQIKKEAQRLGILVYEVGVLQPSDIVSALEQYVGNVDAIVTPTDNLVATSISFIASFCNQHRIPLIVSDNLLLQYGVLASFGIDYYQAGIRAGECAVSILKDEQTPDQIGFEVLPQDVLLVNKVVYEQLKDKLLFDESSMKFWSK